MQQCPYQSGVSQKGLGMTDNIRSINDDYSSAEQLTSAQIEQAVA